MTTKNTYVLARQSWYDTSSYRVSTFWAYVSEHKTLKKAEKALKRRGGDGFDNPYAIFEVSPKDYKETISQLKYNAGII